jgi:hypothetical protein
MAISKKSKRAPERKAPDASAFVALIDKGLAEPEDVVAAYQQALRESMAGMTYAERLQACMADGGVVQKRLEAFAAEQPKDNGRKAPAGRLILLARDHTFNGTDAHNPQEEA